MKISKLIKTLQNAKKEFGDVPVMIMDEEAGGWEYIFEVLKLHPYTGIHGSMDRTKPVHAVAMVRVEGFSAEDLLLAKRD